MAPAVPGWECGVCGERFAHHTLHL
ncbi:YgiT-type zinc finger protein [Dictyobacter kobayashii]